MRAFLLSVTALLVLVPAAAAGRFSEFRTPSGNIGCVYMSNLGPGWLRCEIRSGLRPRPPKPRGCDLDWGDTYYLNPTGRAQVGCHGDTAILPGARVLRYGSTWKNPPAGGEFVCESKVAGLRCRNRNGHGFVLSKQHSYRF
jgi:hypothetical protein